MPSALQFDGGSFKDPSGRVFLHEDRVFRTLNPDGRAQFDRLVESGLFQTLVDAGSLVPTTLRAAAQVGLPEADVGTHVLEHERIPFVTYPYEWSFEMLRDAALLTLDILDRALDHELILKDATPFNVQFHGAHPVFIDVLSFEPHAGNRPWMGYAQFCSTFLYPLMLTAYKGVEFHPLLRGTLGTVNVTDMSRLLGWRDLLRPGVFKHVALAARLQRSFQHQTDALSTRFAEVNFGTELIRANVAGLRRVLRKLVYREADSAWREYATTHSYDAAARAAKETFVTDALAATRPAQVWDLGCNVGEFSQFAAEAGAAVLAIDGDPACIDRLYRAQKAGERSPRIQPLVGDLTNPSPGMGWALAERRPWGERGRADFFLALALVHHLAIGSNVPLDACAAFLRDVAPAGVVEFVARADAMVQRLLATRDDVFPDYTLAHFEACLTRHFAIQQRQTTHDGTRVLFHLGPRA